MSKPVGCVTVFKLKVLALIEALKQIPGTEDVVKEMEGWIHAQR